MAHQHGGWEGLQWLPRQVLLLWRAHAAEMEGGPWDSVSISPGLPLGQPRSSFLSFLPVPAKRTAR